MKRINFHKLPDEKKRVQVKKGINFFFQFFQAIPDESLKQMSEENLKLVIVFLSNNKDRFERELKCR